MPPAIIDAAALERLLPITEAVEALDRALREPLPASPQRTRAELPAGELLLMPSIGTAYAGVKLVTVAPENPARGQPVVQAAYVLFDAVTLSPVALVDGTALTTLRTAAVSALATRYLARQEASRLVIFGAGVQAGAHLDAMAAVRPVEEVRVVSRTAERARALADRAAERGARASVADPDAVSDADIVCTCTTSSRPVFDGRLLPAGCHVNAVGAYRPEDRELDDDAVREARIVVETRETALAEAGDLLLPLASGAITRDAIVAELAEVVRGAPVRRGPEDVTVFKSVGVAFEDLVVAGAAYERAARP